MTPLATVVAVWLLMVAMIGAWARARGRSFFGWALLAAFVTPVGAVIGLLVLPRREHGPVAILASSLNNLGDQVDRKVKDLCDWRRAEMERQDDERSRAEVDRMTQVISERVRKLDYQASRPASAPMPQGASPVFGRRQSARER